MFPCRILRGRSSEPATLEVVSGYIEGNGYIGEE